MRKLLPILLLAACTHKMCPTVSVDTAANDSVVTKYVQHDSIVYVPGESVQLVDTLVRYVTQTFVADSNRVHLRVTVDKNGKLTAKCNADSLMFVLIKTQIDLQYYKNRTVTITKTITVTEKTPYIPNWVWVLLAINVALVGLKITSLFYKPETTAFSFIKNLFK